MYRRTLLVALGLSLLSFSQPVDATMAVKRDFPQLVARAEQIIVGTVTAIQQETDVAGAPWTLVTLSDLDVLKGSAGETFTLRVYGGTAGGADAQISDVPTFTVGARTVLFVAGNGRDLCPLVGVSQGRFRVRLDAARSVEVIEDDQHNAVIGRAGSELQRAPQLAQGQTQLTLDQFRQLISDELANPSGAADGK